MHTQPRVLRSIIFTPGNQPAKIQKAGDVGADAVTLDLEDAVPMKEKETARAIVRENFGFVRSGGCYVFVRINGLETELTLKDLEEIICGELDAVWVPKVESGSDLEKVDIWIRGFEEERGLEVGRIGLLAAIESAKGILNAPGIASAKRVIALGIGSEDLTYDLGVERTKDGDEVFYARHAVVMAAAAAKVLSIDGVFIDFRDSDGLMKDVKRAKSMGFKGKTAIHPSQVEPINKIFSPLEEEVNYARKVVLAFREAEEKGLGAVALDGRMIDPPVVGRALKVVEMAEAIAKKEAAKRSALQRSNA